MGARRSWTHRQTLTKPRYKSVKPPLTCQRPRSNREGCAIGGHTRLLTAHNLKMQSLPRCLSKKCMCSRGISCGNGTKEGSSPCPEVSKVVSLTRHCALWQT
eukprot:330052-Prorocentrum_minimum.AAC.12